MSVFDPSTRSNDVGPAPSIQRLAQLPTDTSGPNTLITQFGMRKLGFDPMPAAWLFRSSTPLTPTLINAARHAAVSAGLVIETRSAPKSYAPLRNWATAAGILIALGVLAMTVGLIRSESGRDLATLSAAGASSRTRRNITAASTGALATLAAVLGAAGAYAALLAWHRSDLHVLEHVPWTNLALVVFALPVLATVTGWLVAGREPPSMARQPLE
jgi:putative ABC transport system permease protein